MAPGQRVFLAKYSAQFAERAAARRERGAAIDMTIASALERIAAGMRAELAAAPEAPPAMPYAGDHPDKVTWKSPVFNVGGRFSPFAGTKREGWLASADACDRLGCHDVAREYRRMADDVDPDEMPDAHGCLWPGSSTAPQIPDGGAVTSPCPPRPRRSTWTGPPMPPAEPIPFVAGEQIGFSL